MYMFVERTRIFKVEGKLITYLISVIDVILSYARANMNVII